jgi:hypothetical protein
MMIALSATSRAPASPGGATPDAPQSISGLAWFAGSWETDDRGRYVEEHWTRPAGGTMLGMSRTVRGDKTVAFEFIRLESRSDGIFYVAQPQGRPPVDFKLASLHDQEATFVNPGHADHLKKIVYRKNADGSLTARIEGQDGGQSFSQEWQLQPQGK